VFPGGRMVNAKTRAFLNFLADILDFRADPVDTYDQP
jgi:hypothetical protein